MKLNKRIKNIAGNIYGRLTVIEPVEYLTKISKKLEIRWICECSCNNKTRIITQAARLRSGTTKSCGCYRVDNMKSIAPLAKKANTKQHPSITSARSAFRGRYKDGDLTFEEFYKLSQQNCSYCNTTPSNIYKTSAQNSSAFYRENCEFIYNGLDRISSSLPHNKNNVVTCCYQCNWAKSNMTLDEWINWLELLCKNN